MVGPPIFKLAILLSPLISFLCNGNSGQPVKIQAKSRAKQSFVCQFCPAQFSENSELAKHEKSEHEIVPQRPASFRCKFCNKTFRRQWLLKDHENSHSLVKSGFATLTGTSLYIDVHRSDRRILHKMFVYIDGVHMHSVDSKGCTLLVHKMRWLLGTYKNVCIL